MKESICPFCETEGDAQFMPEYIGTVCVKKRPCGSIYQSYPIFIEKSRCAMCLRIEALNQRIEHLETQIQTDF